MGKMNELKVLAHEAGIAGNGSIEDLRTVCVKLLLGRVTRSAALTRLAEALQVNYQNRAALVAYVHLGKIQAVALTPGAILHHCQKRNRDGTPMRVRVSGKCQTWKTRPTEWKLPVKYGMYESGYIDQNNCSEWYVA